MEIWTDWRTRRAAHEAAVDDLLAGHRWRSSRAIKHPIEDFLFEYYSFRPYQLRRWHPGHGVVLADASDYLEWRDYRPVEGVDGGAVVDTAAVLRHRGRTVKATLALLEAIDGRAASFSCFGMHEWAMVYQLDREQTRHPQLPLRFPREELASIVEEHPVRCSHFDAFRFFTPDAKPLNQFQPTRETQLELDQPGCLHVGMDLYKHAYKLSPLVSSELVLDCFRLASRIRELDMRASAYDVSEYGLAAVKVETASGRAEYARLQRELAEQAQPLRTRLIAEIRPLAALTTRGS